MTEAADKIRAACAALGVTMTTEFVPWSKSRNAKPTPQLRDRSLNWRVTLLKDGREMLTTDYMAGIAHCPSYKKGDAMRPTLEFAERIARETESGKEWRYHGMNGPKIEPSLPDVVASLVMDAGVINAASFDEWASDMGLDTDSRKAEAMYRACLDTALRLRNALGDDGLATLIEAAQDY